MATSGRGTGILGYNVQTAVDVEHHLIVAHEVTNVGQDRTQLVPMALKAQEATGNEEITVLADRGYFNGDQVLACENTGVLPCVPKTLTSSSAKRGLFTRQDFVYDAENDHYTCPAGEHLTRGLVRSDRRGDIDQYRHLAACFTCPLKPKWTPDKLSGSDQDAEAGPHRDEPPRSGLQYEAGNRDHRCRTAAASNPGLSTWIGSETLPQPDCGGGPPSSAYAFFHGLDPS